MRVTKKLSKEFGKTESRILGALSKLDELLLNPQVRTCSIAVPGTSRKNSSEIRETPGDRSSDDPYPEVGYFSHHSGQLNSPETESNPHNISIKFCILLFGFRLHRFSGLQIWLPFSVQKSKFEAVIDSTIIVKLFQGTLLMHLLKTAFCFSSGTSQGIFFFKEH